MPVAGSASRAIVGRRLDPWLLGGAGIAAWVVLSLSDAPALDGAVSSALLALAATHFAVSYHLAYGVGGPPPGRHRVALVAVPVTLVAAIGLSVGCAAAGADGVATGLVRAGLVAVYALTMWHYAKQTYGVVRLAAAVEGRPVDRSDARLLRYGLYPVWLAQAAVLFTAGEELTDFGVDLTIPVLPASIGAVLDGWTWVGTVALAVALLRIGWRARRVPPAAMWAPTVSAVLWIGWRPDHASAVTVLAGLHALQYLACAHRTEAELGAQLGERPVVWWVSVFGGALAAGLLLTSWVPRWLGGDVATVGGLLTAGLFVLLNLHHYAIDAVIWRSTSPHVVRIVRADTAARAVERPFAAMSPAGH